MARLELKDIRKSFGGTDVLRGIDLDVEDGEFMSLVGASGCGKSTLLRIISGLENADSGQILLDGRPVGDDPPSGRNVAMVFQDYALYPHMSVAQNMAMPLVMARLPIYARLPGGRLFTPHLRGSRADIALQVEKVAGQLRIDHLLSRRPAQLSGGQRQRVALGRALVRNPSLFLMDEPLSNLDAKLRVEVRKEIVELHRKSDLTFVYVTHDQTEAMTMSDRVALLRHGRLLQVAMPGSLYFDPATIDVARFIGSPEINLFPARRKDGTLSFAGVRLSLSGGPMGDSDLMVAIRPEALVVKGAAGVASSPLEGPQFSIGVTREAIEDLGAEIVIHGRIARMPDIALRIRAQKSLHHAGPVAVPAQFDVRASLSSLLFFGADGQRINGVTAGVAQKALAR
ncbi:multiple sugar transport system ATP-binding protein [Lutimaribacter pacificus]|uniref:Carbohydrate ABC transporter ATP-binding protein, CUT1 family n=1 Tax=Lutimaribacter pacificus TaxID=391948 RepID=A0A1H0L3T0_9RHOB|nr:ABC transporter ATP-binding protein [Lutimaribacter pacificus]SDO62879.1 multiple sugar transport system ATP-binding protein [Lutimaribacter pacificus]SHK71120.1 carbohydrate ABC transporter ATP-binding protein, CUT1 family [Lutimaribacter pacificus]